MSSPSTGAHGSPSRAGHEELEAFIERLSGPPRSGFLALRALALSLGPDVVEQARGSDMQYLRRDHPFLCIHSVRRKLTAAFPRELHVPDPSGRLLKHGTEDYVPLESAESLDGHLHDFVRRAYSAAR